MSDSVPVASTGHRPERPARGGGARLLARHISLAAGIFVLAAAVAYGLDALRTPERSAAIAMVFGAQIALCLITTLLVVMAPRWSRVFLSLTGPLLAVAIGVYHALVGAPVEECVGALSLYLGGAALLIPAGPLVQTLLALGAVAGYACATLSSTTTPVPVLYSTVILGAVTVITVVGALLRERARSNTVALEQSFALMQTDHAHATALLDMSAALGITLNDFDALTASVTDQLCRMLDADWAVFWHRRHEERRFRVAAVSGLPPALARTVHDHVLDPDSVPLLFDRLAGQQPIGLGEREARRLLPLDMVVPVLRRALACRVVQDGRIVAVLFACYATTRGPTLADAERLLAGIAAHVGVALRNAHLVDDARSASLAKSEFIAILSHELRTPINVVMGYADLLIEGVFGDASHDQLDVLNRVRHQAAQLLDLVQPMLDLTRLEARQTSVTREPFRVAELIESLQLTVPASWCKPGVVLSWYAPIGPDVVVHSDRSKLEMIVRNLIHNALKYTDRGEVTVDIDSTTPGYVRIIVRDTGTGIAATDLPVLFEMFGQSTSELPRAGGVGLGLYIVKRLTDVLGGRVSVESERGTGSTFTVTLPLDAPPA